MKFFKNTKEIVILLFALAIVSKIFVTDLNNISLPSNLTDILSLSLALFSVALSALFYFKANEASNKFYDNTYQFTKDISEKIGRIEERFGKDLTNIEKGYSRMLDKMEKLPWTESIQEEIDQTTDNQQQLIEEKEKIIDELIQKSSISDEEKQKISSQLNEKDMELESIKGQLFELKSQLRMARKANANNNLPPHTKNVIQYILKSIMNRNQLPDTYRELISLVEDRIKKLNDNDINILIEGQVIDTNLEVTLRGRRYISEVFKEEG
ncbi:hypothetical protein MF625_004371 [Paenibacillus polymyxa]|uniref:hypothetical protein n=1 Tax=Paenibacillus polymyxa TaxID=1406 RepID=UPI0020243DE9|nr:hypothetical protein [Paenibacillus polymyxa]URJ35048.1 hypothetical protein MF625_004371 [Paenibacillus polymyxa]